MVIFGSQRLSDRLVIIRQGNCLIDERGSHEDKKKMNGKRKMFLNEVREAYGGNDVSSNKLNQQ